MSPSVCPSRRQQLDTRCEVRGTVDDMGHRTRPELFEVVELFRERGHERLVAVDGHRGVEHVARLLRAVDGSKRERLRAAAVVDVRVREQRAPHGKIERGDRGGKRFPLRPHHERVDHGDAVVVDDHARVRHAGLAAGLEPRVDAVAQLGEGKLCHGSEGTPSIIRSSSARTSRTASSTRHRLAFGREFGEPCRAQFGRERHFRCGCRCIRTDGSVTVGWHGGEWCARNTAAASGRPFAVEDISEQIEECLDVLRVAQLLMRGRPRPESRAPRRCRLRPCPSERAVRARARSSARYPPPSRIRALSRNSIRARSGSRSATAPPSEAPARQHRAGLRKCRAKSKFSSASARPLGGSTSVTNSALIASSFAQ